MGQREITDIELNEGSMGVDEDVHYDINCIPVKKIGTYRTGSLVIDPNVLVYFRKCKCGRHQGCDQALEQFRTNGVPLPTDGVSVHRPGCSFERTIRAHFEKDSVEGIQRKYYIYHHACTCRYTVKPKTAHHKRSDWGKILLFMYMFVINNNLLSEYLILLNAIYHSSLVLQLT